LWVVAGTSRESDEEKLASSTTTTVEAVCWLSHHAASTHPRCLCVCVCVCGCKRETDPKGADFKQDMCLTCFGVLLAGWSSSVGRSRGVPSTLERWYTSDALCCIHTGVPAPYVEPRESTEISLTRDRSRGLGATPRRPPPASPYRPLIVPNGSACPACNPPSAISGGVFVDCYNHPPQSEQAAEKNCVSPHSARTDGAV